MTDKLRVEEIAIGLCKNPTKHGRVTCPYCLPIAQALLSFAKQEAEPLVEALIEVKSQGEWAHKTLCRDFVDYGRCAPNSICDVADVAKEALTAWRKKYGEGKL